MLLKEKKIQDWMFPAKVHNIKCDPNTDLKVVRFSWKPPFNGEFLNSELIYEVLVKTEDGENIGDFSTVDSNVQVTLTGKQIRQFNTIKSRIVSVCVADGKRSAEAIFYCDLDQF